MSPRSYGAYTRHETPAVIDRVGESRTNNEVAGALAARLGLDAALFPTDPRVLADSFDASGATRSRPEGGTVQFRDTLPDGGRARLAGLDEIDVPQYRALDSDYPLALISPASPRTINSMFGEFEGPDPVLRMHSQDAAARGLADGATIRVFNDRAELTTTLTVDDDLLPGVVSMPKGLWRRALPGGLTANAFVPDTLSDLAGGACFNDARVDVAAV